MSRGQTRTFRVLRLLAAGLLLVSPALAQYFGRNKVQWEDFDFRVHPTEHFDIYWYPEENRAATDAARMAERWYDRLSRVFGHTFDGRKPIILYADHADFQQTNITAGLIGEGTGGFTEPLQDRVVMPLTGVYADTDHVLGHELVHAFQFDIASRMARGRRAVSLGRLPLWMVEGLAEYLSQGRDDPQSAVWLRDALLHDRLPDIDELSRDLRFSPYHYGQAVWAYIAGRWGDRVAVGLFRGALEIGMEPAFERYLGLKPKEFSRQWHEAVKAAYGPIIARRAPPEEAGERVLTRERTAGRTNLAPVLSPDGERVAFLSTRGVFGLDLYLGDARTGKVITRLFSASSDPHFDALRFIDSAGSWSPDGQKFAFVAFTKGTNQIAVLDVDSREIERRIELPGAGSLSNPAWSPDGRRLAVSGTQNGVSDLYLFDLESGETTRLTDDLYADLHPTWSPDGSTLAFVSDRGPETDLRLLRYAPMRIYLLGVSSRSFAPVPLFATARHINPQFSPDGRQLYFIADPGGISDVFRASLEGGAIERLTSVSTGVTGITDHSPALTVSRLSGRVMFSVLKRDEYEIDALPAERRGIPVEPVVSEADRSAGILPPPAPTRDSVVEAYLRDPGEPDKERRPQGRAYRPKLSLAMVGSAGVGVAVDRFGYGLGGAVSMYFTDVFGDRQLGLAVQGGTVSGDLGATLGAQAVYLDLSKRFQWGAGLSHIPSQSGFATISREVVTIDGQPVLADVVEQTIETVTSDEAVVFSQFPLSRTRRFEASVGYTHLGFDREVERVIFVDGFEVDRDVDSLPSGDALDLYQGSVAYVGDNSSFGFVSPVRGGRMRVELGSTFGSLQYQTALVDLRHYTFLRPFTLAVRGLHFGRYGSDAESPRLFPLYLGRETLVRGYAAGDIDSDECGADPGESGACPVFDRLLGSRIGVVNLEFRVPLFGTEDFGLLRVPFLPTELALFADAGAAWNENETPDLKFAEDTVERVPVFSAGVAARIVVGGFFPLQFYYAVPFQRPRQSGVFGFLITPGW